MSEDNKSKDQVFYIPLSKHPLTPSCRELLENYAKIPAQEVDEHIIAVRDEVWDHYPYPSIGLFVWLDLGLSGDDLPSTADFVGPCQAAKSHVTDTYETILSKLKTGGKFLDVGCMFAQDSRKLIHDGASPESIYCTDLRSGYFESGRNLFRDESLLADNHCIAADILDSSPSSPLKFLEGELDVLNATHLLHVFSIEDQLKVLVRFIGLLKGEKGVICTGRLTGHTISGYKDLKNSKSTTSSGGDIWEHNEETFMALWKDAGRKTGSEWDVKCRLWKFGLHTGMGDDVPEGWHREKGHGMVTFVATRLN